MVIPCISSNVSAVSRLRFQICDRQSISLQPDLISAFLVLLSPSSSFGFSSCLDPISTLYPAFSSAQLRLPIRSDAALVLQSTADLVLHLANYRSKKNTFSIDLVHLVCCHLIQLLITWFFCDRVRHVLYDSSSYCCLLRCHRYLLCQICATASINGFLRHLCCCRIICHL